VQTVDVSKLDVCVYHCNKQVVDVSKLEVCVYIVVLCRQLM